MIDEFFVCAELNFETDGIAFAAVVQLCTHAFKQGARLFFLQVEVAVAGDAEGGATDDLVAGEEARRTCLNEFVQEEEAKLAGGRGQPDETRQRAGYGEDAEDVAGGAAALSFEQKGDAECLIEDARKGVRGVNGDGREQSVDFAIEVVVDVAESVVVELVPVR